MKKLLLWIIIATMAIPLSSCSEDPVPPATIDFVGGQDDLSLNFSHQSSTQSVVFSSNYDWTATPSDEWIKVTPESGKAGEKCEITISLDANDTYEKRSGSIVINAQELNVVLAVSQEQNNAIILSTPTVNLPQAGGAFTVKLKANIDYEYEIKADWIKSVETRALKEYSLRFEAETNPSFDKRVGEIVIKGGGFSETVTITQAQTASITLSTTEQNFDSEGGTFEVEVEHSVDYDVKISADWVTQIESRAVETSTLHFAVAENTTYGERKATITIKGGDITETITVVQTQNNAIILSTPTVNLPQAGGAFTVKLKANIDYEYEIKADWIKSVETRALTEYSLRFEAEANPSFDKRVGEIIIKGDGFSETVTVTQALTNVITLSTTEQNFACGGGEFSVEVQYNVDYTVKISDCWVTQIESSAVETTMLHFAVAENTTDEKRTATITISGNGISETLTVKQDKFILPNNELRYTTTDGQILALYDTSAFGTTITSHTYSNGQGIITFDAPVTSIGNAFCNCAKLESVNIPDSITSIGDDSFSYCTALTKITIPYNVSSIGSYTFSNCSSLTTITITDGLTSIGKDAFYKCNSLTRVNVQIYDFAKYCSGNTVHMIGYDKHLFINGTEIIELVIPESVTSIGEYAFSKCTSLTSVTIPDSVTEIGEDAFEDCTSLKDAYVNITDLSKYCTSNPMHKIECNIHLLVDGKEITKLVIPNSVTSIGEYAFSECTSLTSITIPDCVTEIGSSAFEDCTSLKDAYVNITDLSKYCTSNPMHKIECNIHLLVDGKEITELMIPNSVTSIGKYAFSECTSMVSVTIPNSVTSIGMCAFFNCTSLKDAYVNITDLSKYCTSNPMHEIDEIECNIHLLVDGKEITELVIPNSVTSIGEYAFSKCTSLTSVTIPDCVTSIGPRAFYGCTGELTVNCNIPTNASYHEYGVFYGSKFTKVTIGDSVSSIGCSAFACCALLKSVIIPNSVTMIGDKAFYQCTSLISVTIPDCVTSIKDYTFFGCASLTSVTIPNSITSIGRSAFSECTSLISITIPDSVTSIGEYAFSECASMVSVTIPNSVTSIQSSAFSDCSSLVSIHCMPTTPPTIGDKTFSNNAYGRIIYVPISSVSQYRSSWDSYKYAITNEGGTPPFKLGDLVVQNGALGVVFQVSDSTVQIVSVTETSAGWGTAKTWCSDYGAGWCLPSRDVLTNLYTNKEVVNYTLSANGYTTIGNRDYWSSSESHSDSWARYFYKLDFSNGEIDYDWTGYSNYARAVLAF